MTSLFGILFALACSVAGNVGFIYKHRGACAAPAVDMRRPVYTAKALFASRLFAIGMLIAAGAWILHVAAIALAPLSLVQTVLAGGVVGLALTAERMLGLQIERRQWAALSLVAFGLTLLALTLPANHHTHSRFSLPAMIGFEAGLITAGAVLIIGRRIGVPKQLHGFLLGAAAGMLFAVSDIAIKATSSTLNSQGVVGVLSPWTLVIALASIAAFYASAKGLQDGDAVAVIAVTGTAANLAAVVGGIIVFDDPLSGNPILLIVQCLAFAFVLTAAWLMPAPVRASCSTR